VDEAEQRRESLHMGRPGEDVPELGEISVSAHVSGANSGYTGFEDST
jgi:hypothetical protein